LVNWVLGINAFHGDASACLLADGVLVAAAEEERFRRIKHWAGFPSQAIAWCLREANAQPSDIQHIAINQDVRAAMGRKLLYIVKSRPSFRLLLERAQNKKSRLGVVELLNQNVGSGFSGQVHAVEHHLAHLASAYYASPFENAAVTSVDGFGDFASTSWGIGHQSDLVLHKRIYFPHSLGIFYQALTQYLGFPNYGDEYKVMGLAPYGEPEFLNRMRQIVHIRRDGEFRLNLSFFRHARERVEYEWQGGEPHVGCLYTPALEHLLGPARKADAPLTDRYRNIARSVQAMYEEAVFALLNAVHARYGVSDLALAGGCAMNSVANGKVYSNTPFKRIYVQAAAGDAGGAIGAAVVVHNRTAASRPTTRSPMTHAYWGPRFSDAQIGQVLEDNASAIASAGCQIEEFADESALTAHTAKAIAAGLVVGWFQGRMEWGPRALGNRSIVCDPRRADMKDILNLKIKRRESFRPFAPSILREEVPKWFEVDDDVPFMMQVYPIRQDKRKEIPAVCHVDGSGRLQTVSRATNERYYNLIRAFADLTGVPLVLNTSFNENEPVVCSPQEALNCFLRTKMDLLVLGNRAVSREA
jgi:carbamoyltransferase